MMIDKFVTKLSFCKGTQESPTNLIIRQEYTEISFQLLYLILIPNKQTEPLAKVTPFTNTQRKNIDSGFQVNSSFQSLSLMGLIHHANRDFPTIFLLLIYISLWSNSIL